ncbi:MAG TPA: nucleoside hydrolase [Pseudonocardiaceae bacterium]|nr:nucleoside hydrolase [Pseudonocardiaceae bacterium]
MSIPIIIDTDPGVDDAVALLLAAASPEVQVLAVTTVFGNVGVELTTSNALRLRALAGLGHVPVASGAARPLVYPRDQRTESCHGPDGLGGRVDLLPESTGPLSSRGAVALLADLLLAASHPVTLVPIGPLTNIALLLAAHPEVKHKIGRIVTMGGHLVRDSQPESNIRADPEAAHRVLVEEDVPTTLVPLDLTLRAVVDGDWLYELASAGPRCAALAGIVEPYRACLREITGRDAVVLHDALAVLEAAVPGTLRATPMRLEVVCDQGPSRGAVQAGEHGRAGHHRAGHEVQVAQDADLPAVSATILDRLGGLR